RDDRLVSAGIELDGLDTADDHAGRLHRRPQLETADVVEARLDPVTRRRCETDEIADLEREKEDRADAERDEDADPEIECCAVEVHGFSDPYVATPRNMN